MRHHLIILLLGIAGLWIVAGSFGDASFKSAGAPLSNTGAPLEPTCAQSGCHDDALPNTGPGNLQFRLTSGDSVYIPGQAYEIAVSLEQGGMDKFGFQVVALRDSDSSNAGKLSLINGIRTQLMTQEDSATSFYQRQYVTHTLEGNVATGPGSADWYFTWTAPQAAVGPVSLYAAVMASNNNLMEDGDFLYLDTLTMQADVSATFANSSTGDICQVFPNPVKDRMMVQCPDRFSHRSKDGFRIAIYNIHGRQVYHDQYINRPLDFPGNLPQGLYICRVYQASGNYYSSRFIKQ